MVTLARRAALIRFAPVAATMFGASAAILVAAMPQVLFEGLIAASGLPGAFPPATPPLGLTARLLALALAFVTVGGLLWATLIPIERALDGRRRVRTPWRDEGYDQPRIDALPQRRPIFAPEELGAPLMSDAAIAQPTPLFEPEPELEAPVMTEALAPIAAPADIDYSIQGLIRRLEAGLARRAPTPPDPDAPLPLSNEWIVDRAEEGREGHDNDARDVDEVDRMSAGWRWLAAG